jgi:hypothetical protein
MLHRYFKSRWTSAWQLSININKCAAASLPCKAQPASRIYCIDGVAIACRDSFVDLGITVSNDLSLELHINSIVSEARQCVNTLFRGFLSRNLSSMR